MARHEREFEAAAEAKLDLDELLGALVRPGATPSCNRRDAIARCLSASEGWRDAAARLGGAFAALDVVARLTDGKEV